MRDPNHSEPQRGSKSFTLLVGAWSRLTPVALVGADTLARHIRRRCRCLQAGHRPARAAAPAVANRQNARAQPLVYTHGPDRATVHEPSTTPPPTSRRSHTRHLPTRCHRRTRRRSDPTSSEPADRPSTRHRVARRSRLVPTSFTRVCARDGVSRHRAPSRCMGLPQGEAEKTWPVIVSSPAPTRSGAGGASGVSLSVT